MTVCAQETQKSVFICLHRTAFLGRCYKMWNNKITTHVQALINWEMSTPTLCCRVMHAIRVGVWVSSVSVWLQLASSCWMWHAARCSVSSNVSAALMCRQPAAACTEQRTADRHSWQLAGEHVEHPARGRNRPSLTHKGTSIHPPPSCCLSSAPLFLQHWKVHAVHPFLCHQGSCSLRQGYLCLWLLVCTDTRQKECGADKIK